jgi:hypothetical protein
MARAREKPKRRLCKSDWAQVLAAARSHFPPDNRYGVLGFGIDRRTTAGRRTSEPALNAYVVHKHERPKHPVPLVRVKELGLSVRPDVIGVGANPRSHAGFTPPFTGLYPGAAIRAQGRVVEFGGVACVLGDDSGPTHLLTAGHLFASGQTQVPVFSGRRAAPPLIVGTLRVNLLDQPFGFMREPLDIALIALNPAGVRLAAASSDGPKLTGSVPAEAAGGLEVAAFLPTAHDASRATTTLAGPVEVQMESSARGTYTVSGALGTEAVVTNAGDSGTILYNGERGDALAVGVCVGQFGAMSVFEPLARALGVLRQGTELELALV